MDGLGNASCLNDSGIFVVVFDGTEVFSLVFFRGTNAKLIKVERCP